MGKFVFAVDTIANRCTDDNDYAIAVSVKTKENFELVLKSKNHYDEQSQTQLSPGIYEMYSDTKLIQSEFMDFQTHLYKYGEMEEYLKEVGFTQVKTYSSFDKEIAINDRCEMFFIWMQLIIWIPPQIKTDRLILRKFLENDIEASFPYFERQRSQ